jgi:hypothetical protein
MEDGLYVCAALGGRQVRPCRQRTLGSRDGSIGVSMRAEGYHGENVFGRRVDNLPEESVRMCLGTELKERLETQRRRANHWQIPSGDGRSPSAVDVELALGHHVSSNRFRGSPRANCSGIARVAARCNAKESGRS